MKILLFCLNFVFVSEMMASPNKMDFWAIPQTGTNFFNETETQDRLKAAKEIGVKFIRLAPNKWKTKSRDFLIGDADSFSKLDENDFRALKKFLDDANDVGLKIVLTTLSTPGCRWTQQNGNQYDKKIWQDFKYHQQMAGFWKELARRLRDHPAVVGYDVINEPAPEKAVPFADWYTGDYDRWYGSVKGTPADLNLLYKTVLKAIREVDPETPILFETGYYATAWGIKYLDKLDDKGVLYSFHMYEPYAYTNYRQKGKLIYPGLISTGEGDKPPLINWDRTQITKFFGPLKEWQIKNKVPSNQILVGEFGVYRQHKGAETYLGDLIATFKDLGWHWAFYSFREDTWPGMDYELGRQALSADWWEHYEQGKNPPRPYVINPLFQTILNGIGPR
jgi:endoglucanase